jgi:hypothetical protein
MLRHYVSIKHANWVEFLPMAEFAINNSPHSSLGTTPFRLNYGRDPRIPLSIPVAEGKVPKATRFAAELQESLEVAKRCLLAAQQRQKEYYDGKRRDVVFQEGEEVLLNTKNIRLKAKEETGAANKLMPRYIGPFRIRRVIGKGAYDLELPGHMQIHPVFHVSLLKPFRRDASTGRKQTPPEPIECDGGSEYFIAGIRTHRMSGRGKNRCKQFLVQWRGYGPEHDSWEPEISVSGTVYYKPYMEEQGLTPVPSDSEEEE